jgi:hypothetical protein
LYIVVASISIRGGSADILVRCLHQQWTASIASSFGAALIGRNYNSADDSGQTF